MNQQFYEQSEVFAEPRGRGEKVFPRDNQSNEKKRKWRWRNLVIGVLIVAALATGLTFWGIWGPQTMTVLPEHTFHVAGSPTLVLNNSVGKITIHAGSSDSIVVHATGRSHGIGSNSDELSVRYEQQGNTVYVTGENGWGLNGSRAIDMDITVPRTVDLQVNDEAGGITIENVVGKITATTMSGGVDVEQADGEMVLSTGSGGILMKQTRLSGQSHLNAGSGGIDFTGSLDPQGNYRMEALSGGIHLRLPSDTAFHLDINNGSGQVSNDFGSSDVGSAPQPLLSLHALSGGIVINKQ